MEAHMDDQRDLDSYLFDRESRPRIELPERRDESKGAERRSRVEHAVTIPALDGKLLSGSVFLGEQQKEPPTSVTVLASATGVARGYYAKFAAHLARHGHAAITLDYRGIGESRTGSAKESGATMHEWGELDLSGAVAWARGTFGVEQVNVVGHSVGGQLLGLLAAPEHVRRVVTVGSQSGEVRLWPAPERWRMALYMYGLIPGITKTVGYLPGSLGIGEDLPPGVALEWASWCRTRDYVVGAGGTSRREAYARLRASILAFGFDDDPYAPEAAVSALMSFYENADITRRQVTKEEARVGHFGFFRDRFEGTLWKEAREFLM
jgi:predicted alpha/beta hydrolase